MRKPFNGEHVEVNFDSVLENGRYVKKVVSKVVKDSDKFEGYTCLDFCLDHLQAIGAELTDVTGQFGDRTFSSIDNMSSQINLALNRKNEEVKNNNNKNTEE